ncbi:MAG TPA: hypothetical protein VFI22_06200, partial [Thermomicrobiales bacterium]|nr:hypothetical protein [Thermomicrobiales bacterium]
ALAAMGATVVETDDAVEVRGPADGLRGVDIDMGAISDTAQTLAAIAPFAAGPTTIRGIAHARLKETDRVAALAAELRKLGQSVEEFPDGLRIDPAPLRPADLDTYDDHRMAMSFAVAALRLPGIRLRDPGCVAKTFPDFFERLDDVVEESSRRAVGKSSSREVEKSARGERQVGGERIPPSSE